MVVESRTIVGAAAAFVMVGVAIWLSLNAAPEHQAVSVQIQQIAEPSWSVQVQNLDAAIPANGVVKTAANR